MIKNFQKTKPFALFVCLVVIFIASCKTTEPAADIKTEQTAPAESPVTDPVKADEPSAEASDKSENTQKKPEQKSPHPRLQFQKRKNPVLRLKLLLPICKSCSKKAT